MEERVELPHRKQAVVPPRKITEYLLNQCHPQGRAIATFFLQLGFQLTRPDEFRQARLELAISTDMTETTFEFGRKFAGVGQFSTPVGRQVRLRTVWVLRGNQPPPIFVTAYPA